MTPKLMIDFETVITCFGKSSFPNDFGIKGKNYLWFSNACLSYVIGPYPASPYRALFLCWH